MTTPKMREEAIAIVKKNAFDLKNLSNEFQDDYEIVMTAVNVSGYTLKNASERLRDNHEIVLAAVNNYGESLQFASNRLRDYREIVLTAINSRSCSNGFALLYASDRLKDDREIVLVAIHRNGLSLQHASEKLKYNRELVLIAVKQNGRLLCEDNDIASKFDDDYNVIMHAVSNYGRAFMKASSRLRNNYKIAFLAVSNNGCALSYASARLKKKREIALAAVKQNGYVYQTIYDKYKTDREIIIAAISQKPDSVNLLCPSILGYENYKEYILKAIEININKKKQRGDELLFAQLKLPSKIMNDYSFILNAVTLDSGIFSTLFIKSIHNYKFFDTIRDDYNIVLAAVTHDSDLLRHASQRLQRQFKNYEQRKHFLRVIVENKFLTEKIGNQLLEKVFGNSDILKAICSYV